MPVARESSKTVKAIDDGQLARQGPSAAGSRCGIPATGATLFLDTRRHSARREPWTVESRSSRCVDRRDAFSRQRPETAVVPGRGPEH